MAGGWAGPSVFGGEGGVSLGSRSSTSEIRSCSLRPALCGRVWGRPVGEEVAEAGRPVRPCGRLGGAAGPTGDTCAPCPSLWKLASSLTAECVWNQTSFTRLREKRGPGKVRRGWGPPGGCRQQHRTPPAPALRGTAPCRDCLPLHLSPLPGPLPPLWKCHGATCPKHLPAQSRRGGGLPSGSPLAGA